MAISGNTASGGNGRRMGLDFVRRGNGDRDRVARAIAKNDVRGGV